MASNDTLYSIWGMYHYDNSLFDGLQLPEGLDRETVIDNILLETAQLEVYYANIEFMKTAISAWSKKKVFSWTKMWQALQAEYNPIENYDRMETWTDTDEEHGTGANNTTMRGTADGATTNNGTTTATGNSTTTNKVNGANLSEGIAIHDQNEEFDSRSGSSNDSGEQHSVTTGTTSGTQSSDLAKTGTHNGRVHGNIGVTTAMQMITEQINLHDKFNIVSIITNDFAKQFCLRVYS